MGQYVKKLTIALINLHGLIKNEPELGIDSDTGGQTIYVLDLARALAQSDMVKSVTIFTRQIIDRKYDKAYGQITESLGGSGRIVRIPFGPSRYLKKESLWPYIDSFIDQALNYIRRERFHPDIVHGHYAESGYAAAQLGRLLGIPTVFTGHSLGRIKRKRLLEGGKNQERIDAQYAFESRIEAEEFTLDTAAFVVTSTYQEIEEQYSIYNNYRPECMEVIPPGIDLDRFFPPSDLAKKNPLIERLSNFLNEPDKPALLAIARPDERKNFEALIRAYGSDHNLQEKANLILIAGTRDDVNEMDPASRKVLYSILHLIDKYDLYGKVAYPKAHSQEEIPSLYRWATTRKSIFVNPAYTEPFGLTLLEAAACGLPLIATNDGGPQDIIGACENGTLINPLEPKEIVHAALNILNNSEIWEQFSANGIKGTLSHYSWNAHISKYLRGIQELVEGKRSDRFIFSSPLPQKILHLERLIITDIDNTLTGDAQALAEFIKILKELPAQIGFGIATGRSKESALNMLDSLGVPRPDILITSVGTEIHFGQNLVPDRTWEGQINFEWHPDRIMAALKDVPGIFLQSQEQLSRYKISYQIDTKLTTAADVRELLRKNGLRTKLIFSLGMFLDVIPIRAGDGLAIRQIGFKLGIPWEHILVAGDSGNDEAMLKGETLGIIVSNHSPELKKLSGWPRIYFSNKANAAGILDGIQYYHFLSDNIEIPNDRHDD